MKLNEPGGCCCNAGGFISPLGGMAYVLNPSGLAPLWYRAWNEPNGELLIGLPPNLPPQGDLPRTLCLGIDYNERSILWSYDDYGDQSNARPDDFPTICQFHYDRNKWSVLSTAEQVRALAVSNATWHHRGPDCDSPIDLQPMHVRRRIVKFDPVSRTLYGVFVAFHAATAPDYVYFQPHYLGDWATTVDELGNIANPTAPTEFGADLPGYGHPDTCYAEPYAAGTYTFPHERKIGATNLFWRLSGATSTLERHEVTQPTEIVEKVEWSYPGDPAGWPPCVFAVWSAPGATLELGGTDGSQTHDDWKQWPFNCDLGETEPANNKYWHLHQFPAGHYWPVKNGVNCQAGICQDINLPTSDPFTARPSFYEWQYASQDLYARGDGKVAGLWLGQGSHFYFASGSGAAAARITIVDPADPDKLISPGGFGLSFPGPSLAYGGDTETMYLISSGGTSGGFGGGSYKLWVTDIDEPPSADVTFEAGYEMAYNFLWQSPSNWAYAVPDSIGTKFGVSPPQHPEDPGQDPDPPPGATCAEKGRVLVEYHTVPDSQGCLSWSWTLENGNDCECEATIVSSVPGETCFEITCADESTRTVCLDILEPCEYTCVECVELPYAMQVRFAHFPECTLQPFPTDKRIIQWSNLNRTFSLTVDDISGTRAWSIPLGTLGDPDDPGLMVEERVVNEGQAGEFHEQRCVYRVLGYVECLSETEMKFHVTFNAQTRTLWADGSVTVGNAHLFLPLLTSPVKTTQEGCFGNASAFIHIDDPFWIPCGEFDVYVDWRLVHLNY